MGEVTEVTVRQWLRYWRNSLADSESGQGVLTKKQLDHHRKVEVDAYSVGKLESAHPELAGLFEGEDEDTRLVRVIFRPTIYLARKEHGKKKSSLFPDVITPIACGLWVSREGWFIPAEPPTIPRDLLTPQADDKFSIAAVVDQDAFLTVRELRCYSEQEALALLDDIASEHEALWQEFRDLSRDLFSELCQVDRINEHYENVRQGRFLKVDDQANAAHNILKLYDWLSETDIRMPLLDSYALKSHGNYRPCVDALDTMAERIGHPNTQFPLAEAQRDALAQVLAMEEGEILAVNGPPGTGKTTFVLSVVASLWAKAALEEDEPPLIIAASTNNQAVTNILEAFGKGFEENGDPLSGHWLPDIISYGGYFCAHKRENEAAKHYHTPLFYRTLEQPDFLKRAESIFLSKAREALGEGLETVDKVRKRLHETLKNHHRELDKLHTSWQNLEQARQRCDETMGSDPDAAKVAEQQALEALRGALEPVEINRRQWKQFCAAEPLMQTLLSALPAVARKRRLKRELFIEDAFCTKARRIVEQGTQDDPGAALSGWINRQREAIAEKEDVLARWQRLLNEKCAAEAQWQEAAESVPNAQGSVLAPKALDALLDISLRFKMFQLTVHYWEARWLLDCNKREKELAEQSRGKEKTGLKAVRPRWKRRMKLTPCIVSTLHSLPSHMTYSVFEEEGQFRDDYLINEIDLLIIDEAGQVAPDVAGASFALAKRALVIGDVHQIKPVNTQVRTVDVGNLMHQQLLTSLEDYEPLRGTGRSVVDGSAMRIAQASSRYRYLDDAEPGMFLREHRRCFDDIISFCNDLCYQGLLLPMRGNPKPDSESVLPPLGYLHIDGRAESPPSGSRINRLEAMTIAEWLVDRREELERVYDAALEDIVGVITPFKAQEGLIAEACRARDIKVGRGVGEMTVGTVHALQGAERPIVLFSAVYSRHADGGFIDRDVSMLNVAVSRAKNGFLVFGDMDVVGAAARGTPRYLLGQYLFTRKDSELLFATRARPDLLALCREPQVINDAEAHDRCIGELLDSVRQRIDMVSPWISLKRLQDTGLLARMRAAVERDVAVNVYTDYRFNTFKDNQHDPNKEVIFEACREALRDSGIEVFVVNQVHSKLIMADERFMCVGSYNWASAAREGRYRNMETSMLYSGNLTEEIRVQLEALQARILQQHCSVN